MKIILSIILILIFLILSLLHFYWAFGGQWGFAKVLPTDEAGKRILDPRKIDSISVGIGLLAFGIFYLLNLNYLDLNLPSWLLTTASWIIPSIFLLRSFGDFKYVGFFKKIKTTDFGKLDSKFFSPLCLGIGIFGLILIGLN